MSVRRRRIRERLARAERLDAGMADFDRGLREGAGAAERVIAYYAALDDKPVQINTTVIRNYHAERNEVLDKASGLRRPYRDVVDAGELGEMIEARKMAVEGES